MPVKCAQESCNNQVSQSIGHLHCAIHRDCFNNSDYDPESCEFCMTHWTNLRENNDSASESKKILKALVKKMRDSQSFKRTINFVNQQFRINHYHLLNLKSYSAHKSSNPTSGYITEQSVISDAESSRSEVISTDRQNPPLIPTSLSSPSLPSTSLPSSSGMGGTAGPSIPADPQDPCNFLANSEFTTMLRRQMQQEISTSLAPILASISAIAAAIPKPGNPGESHPSPSLSTPPVHPGKFPDCPGNPSAPSQAPAGQSSTAAGDLPDSHIPYKPFKPVYETISSDSEGHSSQDECAQQPEKTQDFFDVLTNQGYTVPNMPQQHSSSPFEANSNRSVGASSVMDESRGFPQPQAPPPDTALNSLSNSTAAAVSPTGVLATLQFIINHTEQGPFTKHLPQGSIARSVVRHEVCFHSGPCPSMSDIKTKYRRFKDNNLNAWNDIWLPISQFSINEDNTVSFSDPPISFSLDQLAICAVRMALMQVTGHPAHLDSGVYTQFSERDVNLSIANYVSRNPSGSFNPDPSRSLNPKDQNKSFVGPSDDRIFTSIWKFSKEYARKCALGNDSKVNPSHAVLLPLNQEDFPLKFFQQEKLDPFCAKDEISTKMHQLSSKSILADYEARQAVMSSMSVFLGLDLIRSTEADSDRNEFLRSIAKWSIPGLASLLKACVKARRQLRKEAFGGEVRNRPFVVELIDDEIFIDSLFSKTTVDRIKSQIGWSQSFVSLIAPQGKSRNSSFQNPHGGSRFFRGKYSSSRRPTGPKASPYSRPSSQATASSRGPSYHHQSQPQGRTFQAPNSRNNSQASKPATKGNKFHKGSAH